MNELRFDEDAHEYVDVGSGVILPSITQLLVRAGEVDPTFYTEEGRDRGTAVHDMAKDYELDALDLATCRSKFKPYLLQYAQLLTHLKPTWSHIEVPMCHPGYGFAGRPDRVGRVIAGLHACAELKSGTAIRVAKWHGIQLALQCILVAEEVHLAPERIARFGMYVSPTNYRLEQFTDVRDFARAREIIRRHC